MSSDSPKSSSRFVQPPDYEVSTADVALLARTRWENLPDDEYLAGAPELVIEVLSPSNTADEIYDKETLCRSSGAMEFWVVDPKRRQVKVSVRGGPTATFREGDEIPLAAFGGGKLPVSPIF